MGVAMIERRREIRCTAAALQVVQATLRPGRSVQIIDLSPMGALVETDRPLRPGSLVHVRIVTNACAVSLSALIVHCSVWAIHAEEGVTYRGGLRFDERCARLSDADPIASRHSAARALLERTAGDTPTSRLVRD